jgi:hypothetical protein
MRRLDEILELRGKRLLMCRQVGRVDATGRDAGEDIGREIGKHTRELAENPDLVRSPRTAAGEHESQIRVLVSDAHSLCRKGRHAKRPPEPGSCSQLTV